MRGNDHIAEEVRGKDQFRSGAGLRTLWRAQCWSLVQESRPTDGTDTWQTSARYLFLHSISQMPVRPLSGVCENAIALFCYCVQAAAGIVLLMLCVFIDGTHLSNDGGQKCLPVYLTSGNLDSSICRYLQDTYQTSVY